MFKWLDFYLPIGVGLLWSRVPLGTPGLAGERGPVQDRLGTSLR